MTSPFQGHFDGRGHTVTYSVTEAEKADGLFPYLAGTEDATAEVRDLKVVIEEYSPKKDAAGGALVCRTEKAVIRGVSVTLNKYTAPAESAGGSGLAGTVAADALIENCNVKAAAGAYSKFGGVAYENAGALKNCEFLLLDGASTLGNYGGIACFNAGQIADCRASLPEAGVTAAESVFQLSAEGYYDNWDVGTSGGMVGGIVSLMRSGTINQCASVFNIETGSGAAQIGGIAARMSGGELSGVRVAGSLVRGMSQVGGAVGYMDCTDSAAVRDAEVSIGKLETAFFPQKFTGARIWNVSYCGGIVGQAAVSGSLEVTGCTATADMTVPGNAAGGLVGGVLYLPTAAGVPAFTMLDCRAQDVTITVANFPIYIRNWGGAIGEILSPETDCATTVKDCAAAARLVSTTTAGDGSEADCMGGFVGDVGMSEIVKNAPTFENCRAEGSIKNAWGSHHGGFVGLNENGYGVTYARSKNAVFQNCVANVSVDSNTNEGNVGGFIGNMQAAARFIGCEAYGAVTATGGAYYGGFVGSAFDRSASAALFENCVAAGDVTLLGDDTASHFYGGFAGYTDPYLGTVEYRGCKAYGDITGISAGGFGGQVLANQKNGVTFTDCAAYGNVTVVNDTVYDCGGFVSWISGGIAGDAGSVIAVTLTGCVSYGDVRGGATGDIQSGGLIGIDNATSVVTVTGCGSYAKAVTGTAGHVGGLIGWSAKTEIRDCTYTVPPGVPGLVGTTQPDYVDKGGNSAITPPGLTCAVTQPAGTTDITIAFSELTGITGYVSSFSVSLDGVWFTQLIYTDAGKNLYGVPLVEIAGAKTAAGQLSAQAFTYTLKHTAKSGTAGVKVRITFSDGYARTFTF